MQRIPLPLHRIASTLALLSVGCGGSVVDHDATDAGTKRDAARDARGRDSSGSGSGGGRPEDARADSYPVFREDACADAPAETPPLECDPFAAKPCSGNRACYPVPPRAKDDCHPGTYGTICLLEGTGSQGTPCGTTTDCKGGFLCVKTSSGDQCVRLCQLDKFGACGDGRICREIDVTGSGWGGCE
ncbi:MAG TPA: hypothetical protein VJT73_19570 [Polyangiaceae bacterium]|nr:hypothetical protein [Polyangiaceae bacterium]